MEKQREALGRVAAELSRRIAGVDTVGLGSGSTVAVLLEELAPLLRKPVRGVPTSTQIEIVASRCGFEIVPFKGSVDLVVDGADQVDKSLNLIKGGGGALLREKVLMGSAKSTVVVASREKFAERLCENGVKVPVEVVPLARESAKSRIVGLGGSPEERLLPKGYPYFTENGNLILDTKFKPLESPEEMEAKIKAIPGVAEVGIFTFRPVTVFRLLADGTFDMLSNA